MSEAPVLQILMPMGGLGQRFRAVGVTTPKPLIDVQGRAMFEHALASFDRYPGRTEVVVVVRAADDGAHDLVGAVRRSRAEAQVVMLEHDTRGAVETALTAADRLDPDRPLVILDCDIAFESGEYLERIARAVDGDGTDGLLLSFRSSSPRYSYAETDGDGRVLRTAEKRAISEDALMGSYFFTRAGDFLDAGRALVREQLDEAMPEYYVSLVYNRLLADGRRIDLARGDFFCFGTPEELQRYLETGLPT